MQRRMTFLLFLVLCGLWSVGVGEARSFVFEVSPQEIASIDQVVVSPFLRLTPDRDNFGTYYVGDNLVLSYWSARGGYVSIFDYTPDGRAQMVKNNEPIVAEAERKLYGTVSGPEGMEKFVLVLSRRVLPDRLLVEAMKNPSRMRDILGEGVFFQKAVIQVVTERKMASSFLRFDRVPAEVPAGGKVKLSLFLSDEAGNVLVGRRIQWEVSDGTLESYQSVTNTAGRAEVWYTAPRVSDALTVRISARFEGDTVYQGSHGEVTFTVNPDKLQTLLLLSPETFHVASGETIEFQASLKDLRGKPVEGRSIRWMASKGSFEQEVTYTDASGLSTNRFFAPQVEASEEVEVKVYFEGVRNLLPSEDLSYGTVSGVGVYAGVGFYFADFSEGKPYTNLEELNYRGTLETNHAVNPVYALVMKKGDSLETGFLVNQPLQTSALYLWGRALGNATIRVFLNGQVVFSGAVREGKVDPTDTQVIALGGQLVLGRNRL
ncbi:MAG: hypothetical protein ACP5Q4_04010, partial [Candidatus Caldatribacteriaceae bacterium]